MNDLPVWQLPVMSETGASANAYIPKMAKYHCLLKTPHFAKDTPRIRAIMRQGSKAEKFSVDRK